MDRAIPLSEIYQYGIAQFQQFAKRNVVCDEENLFLKAKIWSRNLMKKLWLI